MVNQADNGKRETERLKQDLLACQEAFGGSLNAGPSLRTMVNSPGDWIYDSPKGHVWGL